MTASHPRSNRPPKEGSPALQAAIGAALAAGRLQRRHFRASLSVETKPDDTPVTFVDRESELLIARRLQRAAPDCGFLGEESSGEAPPREPQRSGARWIVDPLDGTKKFVRGLPFFGPCIALERDGELALGVMHLPALNETLWAERGGGAFLNGEHIQVSDEPDLSRASVVYDNEVAFYDRGWSASLERVIRATYQNPGFLDLYSYAALACGRVDAVVMVGESPWDIAAARVIIEEAGGRLSDFRGAPTVYGGTTLATNGLLHPALLHVLQDCR